MPLTCDKGFRKAIYDRFVSFFPNFNKQFPLVKKKYDSF